MRRMIWLGAFLALSLSAQGCTYEYCPGTADADAYIEPPHVVAQTAPPAPPVQVEVRPAQPSLQAVWVDGHYSWESGRWVWIAGTWQTPRAGYVWQDPVTVQVQGGVRYHPGYWRPQQAEPPPVYRQPSAVPVTVHAQVGVTPSSGGEVVVVNRGGQSNGGSVVNVVTQGTGTVQAQPVQNGGSVTVVQPPNGGSVGVVAQGGVTTVQTRPASGGSVNVVATGGVTNVQTRPANGGNVGVVAQGGATNVQTRPNTNPNVGVVAQGGVTNVQTRPNTGVVQAGGIGTVQSGGVRGGGGVGPGIVVGPQNGSGTVNVQGGVRPATVGGIGRPGVNVQGGGNVAAATRLTCSVGTPFATRGGALVVNGSNLNGGVVMIGGSTAPTTSSSSSQITVQVPSTSRGGTVTVSANGQNASCGSVRIAGEM